MKAENEIPSAEEFVENSNWGHDVFGSRIFRPETVEDMLKEYTQLHLAKQAEFIKKKAKAYIGVNDEPMVSEGSIDSASKQYQQSIK